MLIYLFSLLFIVYIAYILYLSSIDKIHFIHTAIFTGLIYLIKTIIEKEGFAAEEDDMLKLVNYIRNKTEKPVEKIKKNVTFKEDNEPPTKEDIRALRIYDPFEHTQEDFYSGDPDYKATGKSDFDDYGEKGYIPGYSDISLYSKDGRSIYAPYNEPTTIGMLQFGDKGERIKAQTATDKEYSAMHNSYTVDGGLGTRHMPYRTDEDTTFGGIENYNIPNKDRLNAILNTEGSYYDNIDAKMQASKQLKVKQSIINGAKRNTAEMKEIYEDDLNMTSKEWWGQDNYAIWKHLNND